MNVLIDTNVLISAALRDRLPEKVVNHVVADATIRWLVTPEILNEYIGVLQRPKFALPPELIRQWKGLLDLQTVLVAGPPIGVQFLRDPKDAIFLSAAIAVNADYLISGDHDLLSANLNFATQIVSVADFASLCGVS